LEIRERVKLLEQLGFWEATQERRD